MVNPELPVPDGLVLRPFRGVRFAVDDLADVISPPYDLIGETGIRDLLDTHPNNVVRLILPGADGHRYAEARETLRAWLSSGILVADDAPAVYVYEQSGSGILQRGLIGDVGLTSPERRTILPHEDVMPGPVADRLALMRTTEANLEPIFLLYEGRGGPATRLVDEVATVRPPLAEAQTRDGIRHRLWAITDPGELAALNADLRPRQALIADGHHRYATYLALQAEHHATMCEGTDSRATGGNPDTADRNPSETDRKPGPTDGNPAVVAAPGPGPWDFGLALLVDSDSYPPDLKAIHRVIPNLPLDEAVAKAKGSWQVHEHVTLAEGLSALGRASEPAFLLTDENTAYLITDPDPEQVEHAMPADRSPRWRSLNTSILAEFLLPKVWGMRDDEHSVRVVHHDSRAAARLARDTGGTAVLMNPLAVDDVLAVAAQGERVPRKSTSFGPKPRTGLLMRLLTLE
ncbi:hypothetical protein GCM10010156_15230 [Planobispora rosea]|uniref:DUF1015 domain-containing protein n=1 Tax=Planobispora rosea TaxID=35762 RepID=A0A8J3S002_PLARO|nr:DUF1015 domain-containing protein [Planobispora rosea]GGS57482.1 hypothetical protein GCM10010156_15230 [Planobispora rosea]GIH83406.1 hypothetical protein Pro02_18140 [Planobispora rosea]